MTSTGAGERHCLPLLNHLARRGTRTADGALAPTGLRPRHLVALMLLQERGPASQQGLAGDLSLDPRNVVGLLNELEQRDLVTRRRSPADRRRHVVEISESGRRALGEAQQRLAASERQLLRALTEQERATLYDLLARAADGHRVDPAGTGDDLRALHTGTARERPGHLEGQGDDPAARPCSRTPC